MSIKDANYGLADKERAGNRGFYGFKLHMVINEKGEIQGVTLTKGKVDDR
ncbi:transposase, partial [Wolbachia endosymbiont of Madathamugadia hiepei]